MTRLAVLITVTFLSLTVTHARLNVPERTVIPEETVTDLPGPDHTTTSVIDLPSEKPDSDSDLDSFPLTMTSFRPINGHFPRHPLVPFRHKHDCHSHKRLRGFDPQMQERRVRFFNNGAKLKEHVDFMKPRHYNHEHEHDHDDEHHHHHSYHR
ncbi:hypothetical protein F3Y22_tig00116996pilonHSYRG00372 [Hibiscus syriacus]|uniref:Uncharacterized protein n=1 Tax=Hibiscus syriacus TaxID=106335 RepID=A0A6A2WF44_HIBSY|nr:hypothetical protein F3Y22_tig00116996pilonHSYRG00372 [Hibiscus syriacus]